MGYIRINEVDKKITQNAPFNRFRGILSEARGRGVTLAFSHDIGRERDDGDVWMVVLFLPRADLAACFVTVFVGHLDIALPRTY